jgi:hypothetical protein
MATATAFGYTGQVAATVTVAAHGPVTCNDPIKVTATIVDTTGAPVAGQTVAWSFVTSQSALDKINETPTVSDSIGVATTTVTLGAASGARRIRATAGDASGETVVSPSCGGLPSTSTLPAETPGQDRPLAAMFLVALAFAVGSGLTLRRLATTSR